MKSQKLPTRTLFYGASGVAITQCNVRVGTLVGGHINKDVFDIDHMAVCTTINNELCKGISSGAMMKFSGKDGGLIRLV